MNKSLNDIDYIELAKQIKDWGLELGFQQIGICDTDLAKDEKYLLKWLDQAMHGEMDYMQQHGSKRSHPAELIPGTIRVISVRMDYMPEDGEDPEAILMDPQQAYISRYATGRDYHKIIRKRLQKWLKRLQRSQVNLVIVPLQTARQFSKKPLPETQAWAGLVSILI